MIIGGKINEVEIKRKKDAPTTGFDINVNIKSIVEEEKEKKIIIEYEYSVNYKPDVASMRIVGELIGEFSNSKEILKEWEKSKKEKRVAKLPPEFSEEVLNAINYICSVNGTILARVLNIVPPIVMPKLQLEKEKGQGM
jgi:hypothetical protein